MPVDIPAIEAMAPDQASLAAASKLRKPSNWHGRRVDASAGIIWGECQGSGANPYRVMADVEDVGYKCSCPSRKFPCKHVLALYWMFAEKAADFAADSPPDWVAEWMGRRKKGAKAEPMPGASVSGLKSITRATAIAEAPPVEADPAEVERREKAAEKRREQTRQRLLDGLKELEGWVQDQLRLGIGPLISDPSGPCRTIAARLVDASATTLAGRIDEFPARLLRLPNERRPASAVVELGQWVLLARRFRQSPDAPELRAEISRALSREELLNAPTTRHVEGIWEVVGEQVLTQRDGLVRQSTWLLQLTAEHAPQFGLLLDYYPASLGKRTASFTPGDQFAGTLAFFPGSLALRATLAARGDAPSAPQPWPAHAQSPTQAIGRQLRLAPWSTHLPLLLPAGRIGRNPRGQVRWRSADGLHELPLAEAPKPVLFGLDLHQTIGIWDGASLHLLAAQTAMGPCYVE